MTEHLRDICTLLPEGPHGPRIQVYWTDYDGWAHYHAVTMGMNDADLDRLIDRVQAKFDEPEPDNYPWPDPVYQAGLIGEPLRRLPQRG